MKSLVLFFLLILSIFSYGQNNKPYEHIGKYTNGQIKEKGFEIITGTYPTNVDTSMKNALYTATTKRLGPWEFWYENGKKMIEILYADKPKYINMWLSDGTQILKNGNGYYSVYNNEKTNNSIANEKVVFVVKDSIITDTKQLLEKPPYVK